jgi:DNA-binding NtrC family response regulator
MARQTASSNSNGASRRQATDVVVVCADQEVRDVLTYWLSLNRFNAVVANDGYHAAKTLRGGCRWLITDRVLPPWPGLDQFLDLRSRYPSLGIIYIENANVHDTILARVTGASVTLPRPLTRQELMDAFAPVGASH